MPVRKDLHRTEITYTHECAAHVDEGLFELFIESADGGKTWQADDGEYLHKGFKFCPYCGVDLATETIPV